MKKVLFAVLLFVLAFALPVTVYTLINENVDTRERAAEEEETTSRDTNTSPPSIISTPITSARVGQLYSYIVKASDPDGDILTFYINSKPDWLVWEENIKMLKGTPEVGNVGNFLVDISVSDGKWLDVQKFYINVIGDGEVDVRIGDDNGEVAGVSDVSIPSIDTDTTSNNISDDYGLVSSSATSEDSEGQVLGETTTRLPNTSISSLLVIVSAGFAIISVSLFLFLDARMDLLDTMRDSGEYANGKSVIIKTRSGSIIKKRKMEI